MAIKIFDYIELGYDNLKNQINNWLQTTFNKSNIIYSSASPQGQIMTVQDEIFNHNMLYLKNSLEQLNLETTVVDKVIKSIARISGHNPSRAISANGSLRFKLKYDVSISDVFNNTNPSIIINNKTKILNNTNNLNYVIDLGGQDKNIYYVTSGLQFVLNIYQGTFETQTYTGTGDDSQSLSVNVSNNSVIDNYKFNIYYNGTLLIIKDHLYDMLQGELACYTKTGFNGGIDIYFGTNNFGFVPAIGSLIEVTYLLTKGTEGNIYNNSVVDDWKVIDEVQDGNGNTVDIDKIFSISIETDIDFSSDGETPAYTKSVIPYVSRNFVLATPSQFIYHLKRLNMFSKINAFNKLEKNHFISDVTEDDITSMINTLALSIKNKNDYTILKSQIDKLQLGYLQFTTNINDNQIFLYLIPRIDHYLNDSVNYFNIQINAFYLNDVQKNKVFDFLKLEGIISLNTEIVIVQPKISRYVVFFYVRRFENYTEDYISQNIISSLSDFLIKNERTDRISKSDIIQIMKNIDGIDSIEVYFICQNNEDYHKNGMLNNINVKSTVFNQSQSYDPNKVIGLDGVLGDIILSKDEYPLIRGGWSDRNSIYFNENINNNGLNSVNIIFNGVSKKIFN
jgi:hypothetical protein